MFSHIEDVVPGGRRTSDGFIGSMNSFFLRAREALTYELHDDPSEAKGKENDLEDEM
jgi:hypothetical protein